VTALLFSLLGATLVATLGAQDVPTGVVVGRVLDGRSQAPVAGATVSVSNGTVTALTDSAGRFVLRALPSGIVTLVTRRLGYAPFAFNDVVVSPRKPAEVRIVLEPVAATLGAITVRPEAFPPVPASATPVSTQNYSAEEVRRQPGAQEDVLRAISVAPGVGVTNAARNDLVVRGGAPFENLFVVDNIEVPNINHFGSQGSTGGPISLINVRFVEHASISAGGFGARFGDKSSSVTLLTLREGNSERRSGELNVAASQVGAIYEGPIGRSTTFFVNLRQSYLDLLFQLIGLSFVPAYTDATAKVVWRPTVRDAISALTIAARGSVSFNNDTDSARLSNSQVLAPEQRQYFSGVTWNRLVANGVLTTTLGRTYTRYRSMQRDTLLSPVFENTSREGETSLRSDLSLSLTPRWQLDVGAVARVASALDYDVTLAGPLRRDDQGALQPLSIDTTITATRTSAYMQSSVGVTDALRVVMGIRFDHNSAIVSSARFSPRASVAWRATPRITTSLSAGRYWQSPPFVWLAGDARNHTQLTPWRADHAVLSVVGRVGSETKVQLEAFAKRYASYPTRLWRPQAVLSPSGFDDATTDIPFGLEPLSSQGTGTVRGVELFVQKRLGASGVYGQSAVSVSRTRFAARDRLDRRGAFDTPVTANVLVGWRPNPVWEGALRVRGSSGFPYTPFNEGGASAGTLDFARYNAERLNTFFAADVRLDRRFVLRGGQFIAFLDLQNVTNRNNDSPPQWNPRARRAERSAGVGLLPTIGLNWEF
jgi:hypothetical protein